MESATDLSEILAFANDTSQVNDFSKMTNSLKLVGTSFLLNLKSVQQGKSDNFPITEQTVDNLIKFQDNTATFLNAINEMEKTSAPSDPLSPKARQSTLDDFNQQTMREIRSAKSEINRIKMVSEELDELCAYFVQNGGQTSSSSVMESPIESFN